MKHQCFARGPVPGILHFGLYEFHFSLSWGTGVRFHAGEELHTDEELHTNDNDGEFTLVAYFLYYG